MGEFWKCMKVYVVGLTLVFGVATWISMEYDRPSLVIQIELLAIGIAWMSRETYRD